MYISLEGACSHGIEACRLQPSSRLQQLKSRAGFAKFLYIRFGGACMAAGDACQLNGHVTNPAVRCSSAAAPPACPTLCAATAPSPAPATTRASGASQLEREPRQQWLSVALHRQTGQSDTQLGDDRLRLLWATNNVATRADQCGRLAVHAAHTPARDNIRDDNATAASCALQATAQCTIPCGATTRNV